MQPTSSTKRPKSAKSCSKTTVSVGAIEATAAGDALTVYLTAFSCLAVNKSELEKRKELARLIRRRHESFMLHPDSSGPAAAAAPQQAKPRRAGIDEEADSTGSDLDDIDKQNNNYLARRSDKSPRVKTKSTSDQCEIEGSRIVPAAVAAAKNGGSRLRSMSDIRKDFQLGDIIDFVHKGVEVSLA